MKRLHWRKAKTLAMLANRRQFQREFDPTQSSEIELIAEDGVMLFRTETSTPAVPEFIITE